MVVPDTGNADGVTVIEVSIGVGDTVFEGDTLIVLDPINIDGDPITGQWQSVGFVCQRR